MSYRTDTVPSVLTLSAMGLLEEVRDPEKRRAVLLQMCSVDAPLRLVLLVVDVLTASWYLSSDGPYVPNSGWSIPSISGWET